MITSPGLSEPRAASRSASEPPDGEVEHQHRVGAVDDDVVQANEVGVVEFGQQRSLGARGARLRRVAQRDALERDRVAAAHGVAQPHLAGCAVPERCVDEVPGHRERRVDP